jgi:hypothetical protein|tara:strand:- start:1202 stop:1561 length:360 start_codon:yes stop_codon:yes gene_type:complete
MNKLSETVEYGTYEEIKNELIRRSKVIENVLIKETKDIKSLQASVGMSGSLIRFRAALAPIGYPFEPPSWMTENETRQIMSMDDFDSDTYDDIIENLFDNMYEKYGADSKDKKYKWEDY